MRRNNLWTTIVSLPKSVFATLLSVVWVLGRFKGNFEDANVNCDPESVLYFIQYFAFTINNSGQRTGPSSNILAILLVLKRMSLWWRIHSLRCNYAVSMSRYLYKHDDNNIRLLIKIAMFMLPFLPFFMQAWLPLCLTGLSLLSSPDLTLISFFFFYSSITTLFFQAVLFAFLFQTYSSGTFQPFSALLLNW